MVPSSNVESHSYQLLENFPIFPQAFYHALEINLMTRQVPGMNQTRVDYHEGSILSAKREYLRLRRDRIAFDVCAAPFGTSFFVSWRLVPHQRSWLKMSVKIFVVWSALAVCISALAFLATGFFAAVDVFFKLMSPIIVLSALNMVVYLSLRSWLRNMDESLAASPIVGELYAWVMGKETYYRIDTMLMFKEAVNAAILQTISDFADTKSLRPGSDDAGKPVMKQLFGDEPPPLAVPSVGELSETQTSVK